MILNNIDNKDSNKIKFDFDFGKINQLCPLSKDLHIMPHQLIEVQKMITNPALILGSEFGLGKTLSCCLMAKTEAEDMAYHSSSEENDRGRGRSLGGDRVNQQPKEYLKSLRNRGRVKNIDLENNFQILIICPSASVYTWLSEFSRISEQFGKYHVCYLGSNLADTKKSRPRKSDLICIITPHSLASAIRLKQKQQRLKKQKSLGNTDETKDGGDCDQDQEDDGDDIWIFKKKWVRVFIDETHCLINAKHTLKCLQKLKTKSLVLVTATPIQNKIDELLIYMQLFNNIVQSNKFNKFKITEYGEDFKNFTNITYLEEWRNQYVIAHNRQSAYQLAQQKKDLFAMNLLRPVKIERIHKDLGEMNHVQIEHIRKTIIAYVKLHCTHSRGTYAKYYSLFFKDRDNVDKNVKDADTLYNTFKILFYLKQIAFSPLFLRQPLPISIEKESKNLDTDNNNDEDDNDDREIKVNQLSLTKNKSNLSVSNVNINIDNMDTSQDDENNQNDMVLDNHQLAQNYYDTSPMIKYVCDTVRESIKKNYKIIIFNSLLDPLKIMQFVLKRLVLRPNQKILLFTGELSRSKKKASIIDEFQNSKVTTHPIILVSTRVGGIGLNLFTANVAIMTDHNFNPMQEMQAMNRIYRIGQPKSTIYFHYPRYNTSEWSLDPWISSIHRLKTYLASSIVPHLSEHPTEIEIGYSKLYSQSQFHSQSQNDQMTETKNMINIQENENENPEDDNNQDEIDENISTPIQKYFYLFVNHIIDNQKDLVL